MDFKEKYKMALAGIQEILSSCSDSITMSRLRLMLQGFFPELKESEDEQIRKWLISQLKIKSDGTNSDLDLMIEKAIVWLENQKEFVSANFEDVWETAGCEKLTAPLEKYEIDAIKKLCHAWYDKGIELERKKGIETQVKKEHALNSTKHEDVCKFKEYLERRAEAYDLNLPNRSYDIYAFAKELLAWFEKHGNTDMEQVFRPLAGCDIDTAAEQAVEQQKQGKNVVLAFNGCYIPVENKTANAIVDEYDAWLEKQSDIASYESAEAEKQEFVDAGFIKCYTDFQDFKEGKTYWLEYLGNNNYNVRSDNLLGKTYHITPCQLYTIFKKQPSSESQDEQNPESKETEKIRRPVVIGDMDHGYHYHIPDKNVIDWFEKQSNVVGSIKWHDVSEEPKQNQELLCEWSLLGSSRYRWHDVVMYRASDKTFWNAERQVKYVTRWCYIDELKQGEQKHTDNIISNFHEGDWVVQGHNILKIKSVRSPHYCFETVGGYVDNMLISEMDSQFHLWSIEDAKDGDVLVFDDDTIVIFKNLYNKTSFHSYCHIEEGIFETSKDDNPDWWDAAGFYPATKEQRNLLYQMMADAGYEWDEENKKVKKIEMKELVEQKPNCSEEALQYLKEHHSPSEISDFQAAMNIAVANAYDKGKADAINTMKTEWGEEDEKCYNSIIEHLKYSITNGKPETYRGGRLTDWLKFLKDRVKSQAKQ